jgi:outer membrane protein insertion porin family
MHTGRPDRIIHNCQFLFFIALGILMLPACHIVRKEQQDKPFTFKNSFEVKGEKFSKDELIALKSRLNAQLDDSAKVKVIDKLFFWHFYQNPPIFDTAYVARSAKNMQASMRHLGFYRADTAYTTDTIVRKKYHFPTFRKFKLIDAQRQERVHVKYIIKTGRPTLIDTVSYNMKDSFLQQLTMQHLDKSLLQQGNAVTKAAVLGEVSRLVDLYRNNGYYKFTADELRVRGDTTLEALTSISDDPFEQLRLLAEAQQKKDSPKIKLAVVLNEPDDKSRLRQYRINNVYIMPDFQPGDSITNPALKQRVLDSSYYVIKFHRHLFRSSFLRRNVFFKRDSLYNQADYYKTVNSFSQNGAWQSVNIDIKELKDSTGKIDIVIELLPAKQFLRDYSIEASYSANSNTNTITTVNAGNLLGLSGNISRTNRNLNKEAIRWTNSFRAGVEFNLKPDRDNRKNLINSNDIGFSSTAIVPRFLWPLKKWNNKQWMVSPQTFANLNLSYINRINLFNLQSANLGLGFAVHNKRNAEFTWKPVNIEFAKLYNESESFKKTLDSNQFLRYAFNTALVAGMFNFGYSTSHINQVFKNRQHSFKANMEESGLLFSALGLFEKYTRNFIKLDVEYKHSRSLPKSAFIARGFLGAGVPLRKDSSLPFFKQYFAGGSNSMRGWPVRGIGRGSQPLATYANNRFNDRTGDIQLETNLEYRYNIVQIVPNSLMLKGALFIDAGNIWNMRNSKPAGETDSALFKFKNLWRDLGINAGTGFRLDFNYFVLRFDLGFRFKRPELAYDKNGWKIPALSFNDVFQKIFARGPNDEYRRWRYENFNFTIGIGYPF